jgi:HK97 family phage major capsid protein
MGTMTTSELREFVRRELEGDVRGVVERQMRKLGEARNGETRQLVSRMMGGEDGGAAGDREARAVGLSQILRAVASSKGDPQRAADWAKRNHCSDSVVRALTAGEGAAGGFLVPITFSQDVIELLRPASIVRKLNPSVIDMPSGTTRMPKLIVGATANYIGESVNIPTSQPQFGQVTLSFKKLAALVPISNDLIRYSNPSADSVLRDDLVKTMAQRENAAFLRDPGSENTPTGIRYQVATANVLTMTGTDILADIATNLGRLVLALENANVPMLRPGWMFSPRVKYRLSTILNAVSSTYFFRGEMMQGTLLGYPFASSTQVPDSEVYFVDFSEVIIGESQQLIVDSSQEASYWDGTTQQSAYSRDESVVRAILEEDLDMRHAESGTVLTGVTWGA